MDSLCFGFEQADRLNELWLEWTEVELGSGNLGLGIRQDIMLILSVLSYGC